jgi:hypothetical protein
LSLRVPSVDETLSRMKLQQGHSIMGSSNDLKTFIRSVMIVTLVCSPAHSLPALLHFTGHIWTNTSVPQIVWHSASALSLLCPAKSPKSPTERRNGQSRVPFS